MAEDHPGKRLVGKYELISRLGQGGMAVVWRALNHGPDGFALPVAVKRMHPGFMGQYHLRQLFIEEARVGAGLRHPGVVQVHDFGVDEAGEPFLVTELVLGLQLGEWSRAFTRASLRPPWQIVAEVAVQVLAALDAAHTRVDDRGEPAAIFHRDLTPDNVLLDLSGIVKLADFGMARAMDRGRMTQPDIVKGKLSYLAPELVLGVNPSAQSDLFSLGVVLWEVLSGRRLFDAKTDIEVVDLIREARVPMLSVDRPDLPLALTQIVHCSLARRPEERFNSAREMMQDLVMALRVLPEPVDRQSLSQSFQAAYDREVKERLELSYDVKL
ncbi:MAG: serine/threonine protein kinase [Polyangiaceae bacterium]|nr:serine/threonine protein kinase [Polyangiaceae bacterium]MCW5790358.1 serine/threonine protein kinase [Polyangiaceae bacterium]